MIDTADARGPTSAQRAFIQYFEQVYKTLLPKIITVIEKDSRLSATGSSFVGFASTHRLAGI
jgi:hypothetical protein